MHLLSKLKLIKTFVFDMDGVLTDGSLLVNANNEWLRTMNVRDGYALQLAVRSGYDVVVISGSESGPVTDRLHRLGVEHVFMGIKDKNTFLINFLKENKMDIQTTLFMGDDIPDYECMGAAGLAVCPADAAEEIKEIADYVSPIQGGKGCVRDVIEKVMKLNGHWNLHTNTTST